MHYAEKLSVELATRHADKRPYLEILSEAMDTSKDIFKFPNPPLISEATKISDENFEEIKYIIEGEFLPVIYPAVDDYWGNLCQPLACQLVAFIKTRLGIPAEIIIGEVSINGILEYDTTLEGLKAEYFADTPLTGEQVLHSWVSIGGDTIIDAAMPDRLAKYYRVPRKLLPKVLIGRAEELLHPDINYSAAYLPMIYGTDFLAKTQKFSPQDFEPFFENMPELFRSFHL